MTPEESLVLVTEKLESCGIPYMISGSFASSLHGVPRTTHDADIIVEIDAAGVDRLSSLLHPEFYFDATMARVAIRQRILFSAIHFDTGFKIDFIVRKNRPFSLSEFHRKMETSFQGKLCWFSTPEDTILAKLEWSSKGQSERQFNDALNIAKVQRERLDWAYLKSWVPELNVKELFDRLVKDLAEA